MYLDQLQGLEVILGMCPGKSISSLRISGCEYVGNTKRVSRDCNITRIELGLHCYAYKQKDGQK